MTTNEKCTTCNQTLQWHRDNADVVRHAFNDGSLPLSATFGHRRADGSRAPDAQRGSPSPWPFDPVLRQALIDKGVLTIEDLQQAEIKIRTIISTVDKTVYRGGGSDGEQRGGSEGIRVSRQA